MGIAKHGLFVTEEEYPKFVRQEIVVNAVTHRSYSISGTDIQVKMFDDRIVVESPGKLPGLVRADNIRHTHFSRNPRIAEFLKAYNFVKEYGEGVNRMCNELENVGLSVPEYYCNAFILQTIIRNTKNQNKTLKTRNEKSVFDNEKSVFAGQKLNIDTLKAVIAKEKYNEPTQRNILRVYEAIETNQIFGASDVAKILNCSPSTSVEVMSKLRKIDVVRAVKGKGKGKYRFVSESEFDLYIEARQPSIS